MLAAIATPGWDQTIMTGPQDLEDWVAVQRRMLSNVVLGLEHAPLDALILALRQACQNGFGDWLVPDPRDAQTPDRITRPATHLVEIHVLGQQGVGLTVEEAARNWRRAALLTVRGEGGE